MPTSSGSSAKTDHVPSTGQHDVVEIKLRLSPADIAYVKFIFESYEGVAVVRTLDRHAADIVVLTVPDFVADARAILESLRPTVPWTLLEP